MAPVRVATSKLGDRIWNSLGEKRNHVKKMGKLKLPLQWRNNQLHKYRIRKNSLFCRKGSVGYSESQSVRQLLLLQKVPYSNT